MKTNKPKLNWCKEDFTKEDKEEFTWQEAMDNCPDGYHLPAAWEFATLIDDKEEVKALKFEMFEDYWSSSEDGNYSALAMYINSYNDVYLERDFGKADTYLVRYIKD